MSRYFQDEHEHQTAPFEELHEGEDEPRIPFLDVVAAPQPPMPPGFVPNQAAQTAAEFVQSSDGYRYSVHHFEQSQPAQIQPEQTQPGQGNVVQWPRPPSCAVPPVELAEWLRIPNILDQDLQHIHEVRGQNLPAPMRACAEQLARSGRFLEWLQSPAPSQLLVHANDEELSHISGLSLFCASLARVLVGHPDRFIPLVFFCGLHAELPDDDDDDSSSEPLSMGAQGLMRSLIRQLLVWLARHRPVWFPMTHQEEHRIGLDDLGALYELFRRLLRALPGHITVCCLVDGVVYYERDAFVDRVQRVMVPLLQLSASRPRPYPLIKVLLTSPTNTSVVRHWVTEESILSMTKLGRPVLVSDEEGLERILASALG